MNKWRSRNNPLFYDICKTQIVGWSQIVGRSQLVTNVTSLMEDVYFGVIIHVRRVTSLTEDIIFCGAFDFTDNNKFIYYTHTFNFLYNIR